MLPCTRAIGELRWTEALQKVPLQFCLPLETIGVCFMASQLSQGELSWLAHSAWVVKKSFHNLVLVKAILWEWLYLGNSPEPSADHSGCGISWLPIWICMPGIKILITCKTGGFFLNFQASAILKKSCRDISRCQLSFSALCWANKLFSSFI